MTDMILEVKTTVAGVIGNKVNNQPVPQSIEEFLRGPWQEVMKIVGLREGCDGDAWRAAVRVIDDLIWSVQPKREAKEKRRLLVLIPRLLHTLREGLTLICHDSDDVSRFIKTLEQIHILSVRPPQGRDTGAGQSTVSEAAREEILQDVARHTSKHQAFQQDIVNPALLQSRYFPTVNTMALGTWVEFRDHHGSKRGKLAWKCDFTGEFTFLDRMYKVIADVPMRDLIQLLERGNARIVHDVPLLDRAVDAVLNGMKHYAGRDCVNRGYVGRENDLLDAVS
jgi:hypothetical protein